HNRRARPARDPASKPEAPARGRGAAGESACKPSLALRASIRPAEALPTTTGTSPAPTDFDSLPRLRLPCPSAAWSRRPRTTEGGRDEGRAAEGTPVAGAAGWRVGVRGRVRHGSWPAGDEVHWQGERALTGRRVGAVRGAGRDARRRRLQDTD